MMQITASFCPFRGGSEAHLTAGLTHAVCAPDKYLFASLKDLQVKECKDHEGLKQTKRMTFAV
jgi:hypothetical protein